MRLDKNHPLPLYRQLENLLEAGIGAGEFPPDAPLPSERELCRRYQVSHMTVRLALAELARRQLVVRVPGKGTFAAGVAAERTSESVFALVMEYTAVSEFAMSLVAGIKAELYAGRADLMLFSSDEERYFELAAAGKLSGLIITDPHFHDLRLQRCKKLGLPLVVLGHTSQRNVSTVDSDNIGVGYMLARHLLEQGYERIAFLGYGSDFTVTRDRLAGYKKALHEIGLSCPRDRIAFAEFSRESAESAIRKIVEAGADAAVCGDDFLAACAMDRLSRDGIAIGLEFGISGCNNSLLARLRHPALTSVELNPELLGRQLSRDLLRQAAGDLDVRSTIVPCELAVRDSSVRISRKTSSASREAIII